VCRLCAKYLTLTCITLLVKRNINKRRRLKIVNHKIKWEGEKRKRQNIYRSCHSCLEVAHLKNCLLPLLLNYFRSHEYFTAADDLYRSQETFNLNCQGSKQNSSTVTICKLPRSMWSAAQDLYILKLIALYCMLTIKSRQIGCRGGKTAVY